MEKRNICRMCVGNWEGTEVGRRIILKRILEKRYGVVMID
jgi:hypothetical protein